MHGLPPADWSPEGCGSPLPVCQSGRAAGLTSAELIHPRIMYGDASSPLMARQGSGVGLSSRAQFRRDMSKRRCALPKGIKSLLCWSIKLAFTQSNLRMVTANFESVAGFTYLKTEVCLKPYSRDYPFLAN
jgi:hypothetical protein